jgi:hypothetical protein
MSAALLSNHYKQAAQRSQRAAPKAIDWARTPQDPRKRPTNPSAKLGRRTPFDTCAAIACLWCRVISSVDVQHNRNAAVTFASSSATDGSHLDRAGACVASEQRDDERRGSDRGELAQVRPCCLAVARCSCADSRCPCRPGGWLSWRLRTPRCARNASCCGGRAGRHRVSVFFGPGDAPTHVRWCSHACTVCRRGALLVVLSSDRWSLLLS